MMLCAGGGGRSDYEALKYFQSSGKATIPIPSNVCLSNGVIRRSSRGKDTVCPRHYLNRGTSIKFRTDVAMMQIRIRHQTGRHESESMSTFTDDQASELRGTSKPVILEGDLYRPRFSLQKQPHFPCL